MYFANVDKQREDALAKVKNDDAIDNEKKDEAADKLARRSIESEIVRSIGGRLTDVREKQGLTGRAMSEEFPLYCNADGSNLSRWENGNRIPPLGFLVQLHEKWGVDLAWLIVGAPSSKSPVSEELQAAFDTFSKLFVGYAFGN